MEIETAYAVKMFFPTSSFIQVYFEAIANAFDAGAKTISVEISTDGQLAGGSLSIKIEDDGEGFTDSRFDRFRQFCEPQDAYHKGLGRLVYLHYFADIKVESSTANGTRRTFTFSEKFNGESKVDNVPEARQQTVLTFTQFCGKRLKSYDDLKPQALKERVIEQFLPLLHHKKNEGEEFQLKIILNTTDNHPQYQFFSDQVTITASDLPDLNHRTFSLDMFGNIDVWYSITENNVSTRCLTAASIDGRTIPLKLIHDSALPPGCRIIFLIKSPLFEGRSDSARQKLVMPSNVSERELTSMLRNELARLLNQRLPAIARQNEKTKEGFEERYPHLIGLFEEDAVGLIDAKEAIEKAQGAFFRQQREVLESDPTSDDEDAFRRSLEVSARSLTEYIVYRELIIRRLRSTNAKDREKVVHDLIVPQRRRMDSANLVRDIYRNNAWVLDDKFMTFQTILSEAKMEDVIRAITLQDTPVDSSRPDISMVFSADPFGGDKVDVAVVEIKRREDTDKENHYATVQLVTRAQKLVDFCPNIQRIWYYGLIDIDDKFARTLSSMKWVPLFSRGRVFYQEFLVQPFNGPPVPTPVFLVSYDALTADAQARNHAFLSLLRESFKSSAPRSNLPAPSEKF